MPIKPSSAESPFTAGVNGEPKISLRCPDGAQADIYSHGAHVTSWVPAGEEERLFLSSASAFGPNASIRGGVPIIFPQFADLGPIIKHGFMRRMRWNLITIEEEGAQCAAVFGLNDSEATHALWPHHFAATYAVTLKGRQLDLTLSITNTGVEPFTFSCALQTYFKIAEISKTSILGLGKTTYLDNANQRTRAIQTEDELSFAREVDRTYLNVTHPLILHEQQRSLTVTMQGFKDAVIWNPWIQGGAALNDLEVDGYRRMVCVEAGVIGEPITLLPAQNWRGTQSLTAQPFTPAAA